MPNNRGSSWPRLAHSEPIGPFVPRFQIWQSPSYTKGTFGYQPIGGWQPLARRAHKPSKPKVASQDSELASMELLEEPVPARESVSFRISAEPESRYASRPVRADNPPNWRLPTGQPSISYPEFELAAQPHRASVPISIDNSETSERRRRRQENGTFWPGDTLPNLVVTEPIQWARSGAAIGDASFLSPSSAERDSPKRPVPDGPDRFRKNIDPGPVNNTFLGGEPPKPADTPREDIQAPISGEIWIDTTSLRDWLMHMNDFAASAHQIQMNPQWLDEF